MKEKKKAKVYKNGKYIDHIYAHHYNHPLIFNSTPSSWKKYQPEIKFINWNWNFRSYAFLYEYNSKSETKWMNGWMKSDRINLKYLLAKLKRNKNFNYNGWIHINQSEMERIIII